MGETKKEREGRGVAEADGEEGEEWEEAMEAK